MSEKIWKLEVDELLSNPQRRSLQSKRQHQQQQNIRRNASSAITLRHYEQVQSIVEGCLDGVPTNKREKVRQHVFKVIAEIRSLSGSGAFTVAQIRELLTNMCQPEMYQVSNKLLLDDGSELDPHYARYTQDYVEEGTLGEGAFGNVYKVFSKLDKCYYAMKKLKLNQRSPVIISRIRTEVMMIAHLDHPHIVRYHNAWLEEEPDVLTCRTRNPSEDQNEPKVVEIFGSLGDQGEQNESTSTSYNPSFAASSIDPRANVMAASRFYLPSGSSLAESVEEGTQETQQSTESSKSSTSSDSSTKSLDGMQMELVELKAPERSAKMMRMMEDSQPAPLYIYIQMECCESTLSQFLSERNHGIQDLELPSEFYKETFTFTSHLMSAVSYLHENSVIHRDIKPSNIFLVDSNGHKKLKLGDFGLACSDSLLKDSFLPLQPLTSENVNGHSRGVGTALYAAPEQMKTRDYGLAADVFSCGLVIIEMFGVFHTHMQRVQNLEKARQGYIPEYVHNISEEFYNLIVTMLLHMAEARPYANDVVRHISFLEHKIHNPESHTDCIRRLQEENVELRECVEDLTEQNTELRDCVDELRQKIAILEAKDDLKQKIATLEAKIAILEAKDAS